MTAEMELDDLDAVVGSFAVHLRSRDLSRAAAALAGVAAAVHRVVHDGVLPARVSPVAVLPDGPIVRIDDIPPDPLTRRRVGEAIDDVLLDAGFPPGAGVVRDVDGLADLDEAPRAVVMRLFPDPAGSAGRLPPAWIDLAAEWVFGDQDPETLVRLRVLGVEVTVMAKEAAGILHGCARARAWCDVVTGDVRSRLRTASISFGIAPHVAVAAGGPRCDDTGMLARFDLLAEVAREHADGGARAGPGDRLAYACLDFEESFGDLGTGLSNADWPEEGGAPANRLVGRLADRHVPEAYPFQILGPLHVERLGGTRDLRRIGEDRWELDLGQPADWLTTSAVRSDARQAGWDVLAPLLVEETDLDGALAAASEAAGQAGATGAGEAWDAGLPDLASVIIERHPHPRRGMRLSLLELAAWLAGEPHSDDPVNVSPVLRVYARELAAGLDDERRQGLREVAARLAGTGAFGDRSEHRRSWLLADRLLRVHAPAWLEADGLSESAQRLRRLSSIDAETQLVRGVHLLGGAITTASRRLETTQRMAGRHADLVEALAWDLWEEVGARTGWSATAEAVVLGIPATLTFATDQRVMELSRDPEQRAELERSTRGLGDEVWATGLSEVAATAWRSAWDVAEAAVHHETTFSLRTTLRRSLQARLDDDDVAAELLLDDVDRTARDAIARLLLVGEEQLEHWDAAVAACQRISGGDLWARALEESFEVIGAALCQEAMETARQQVRDWVGRAPGLVSRAVVASATREVCSVAGRGLIARVAAEALARGRSEDDAEDAARRAVGPLVDSLADDALAALHELLEPLP